MEVLEMIKRPVTLGEFQKMVRIIYLLKDQRDYTLQDLLIHIQEEAAKIDEGLRKSSDNEQINALPIFFCWFLSFCNMAGYNLEEVVWAKYQGICPYCGGEECFCKPKQKKPDTWFKNPQGKIPRSLPEWQEMFRRMYGKSNSELWPIQIWLHVHEELGEFSREFRLKNVPKSHEELADAFAWLMAYCNKMNVNLAELTWNTYPGICNVCRQEKCQCPKV